METMHTSLKFLLYFLPLPSIHSIVFRWLYLFFYLDVFEFLWQGCKMFPVNFYFIIRSIARVREWTCVFSTWLSREQITVGSSEERHDMKPRVESLTVLDCHTQKQLHKMLTTGLMRITFVYSYLFVSFCFNFKIKTKMFLWGYA